MEYASLRGTTDGMDLTVITEIAEYFEKEIGYTIPPQTPFVGKNFNCTRAGIHADGLLKDEEIYNIFDTQKLLNRPVTVAVDSHSGLAGIAHWLNTYLGLTGKDSIDKKDDIVVKMKELVDKSYADGRTTAMSDEELEEMLKTVSPKYYETIIAQRRGTL